MVVGGWGYINIIRLNNISVPLLRLGEMVYPPPERDWPVHKQKIDVLQSQIVQAVLQSLRHVVRVVLVVPDLGRQEDLTPGDVCVADCFADCGFGAVSILLAPGMSFKSLVRVGEGTLVRCRCVCIRR